jgi:hypothetical protein
LVVVKPGTFAHTVTIAHGHALSNDESYLRMGLSPAAA